MVGAPSGPAIEDTVRQHIPRPLLCGEGPPLLHPNDNALCKLWPLVVERGGWTSRPCLLSVGFHLCCHRGGPELNSLRALAWSIPFPLIWQVSTVSQPVGLDDREIPLSSCSRTQTCPMEASLHPEPKSHLPGDATFCPVVPDSESL